MRGKARSAPAPASRPRHALFDVASSTHGLSVDGDGRPQQRRLQRFVHAVHVCNETRSHVDIVAQHPFERQGRSRWNMEFALWRTGGEVNVSVDSAAGLRLFTVATKGTGVHTRGSARVVWNVSEVCRRAQVVDEWVAVTRVDRNTVQVHLQIHGPTGECGWFVRRSFLAVARCATRCKTLFHFHTTGQVDGQRVVGLVGDRL